MFNRGDGGGRGGGCGLRLLIALLLAGFALFRYFGSSQTNPVTGEKQRVALDPRQEIALGLQSAPRLAQQYGGLSRSAAGQRLVGRVGERLVQNSEAGRTGSSFTCSPTVTP